VAVPLHENGKTGGSEEQISIKYFAAFLEMRDLFPELALGLHPRPFRFVRPR
jgi:hypothetical protein